VLFRSGQVIVAADTAVVVDDSLLGKPQDVAAAVQMLRRLRGRSHQVYTGLAVVKMPDGDPLTDLCITDVPMRTYSDEEIDAYVASGDPLDKAGAYAIQHPAFHPVEKLAGCYASVMGLPLCHLVRTLHKLDVLPRSDVPARCQSALHYTCPISAAVLNGEQVG
jgi:septum formation protein